jgi:hypothetical protein
LGEARLATQAGRPFDDVRSAAALETALARAAAGENLCNEPPEAPLQPPSRRSSANHSLRATGITGYLRNDGTREK